ncbi:hypothetical protein ADK34_06120 [Streptomyces viridochromogenes]|uniref:Uncharacterized protein n=1 Tax=Streptomyces viridochromogenes TaxID=1938 RepID=A0A0L8L9R8_STRVR|nr:hypothetical protein ADK34_06120 [Streptomyces viridochromogenes]
MATERDPVAALPASDARSAARRAADAAEQLQCVFDAFPDLKVLAVYVEGELIGVATRAMYPSAPVDSGGRGESGSPGAGGDVDLSERRFGSRGDGDRSAMPGASRHYTAFTYHCSACPASSGPVYSPSPTPPPCPRCTGPTEAELR